MDSNPYSKECTALLIVDPYNDVISDGGKLWLQVQETAVQLNAVNNMRRLLEAARDHEWHIVFVPHHRYVPGDYEGWRFLNPTHARAKVMHPFARGTWGGEFHSDFKPVRGEIVVEEHWFQNGFMNTDLDLQLRTRGVSHVVIEGMRANTCVEGTARHAVELGYHVTLVRDATAASNWPSMEAFDVNAQTFAHTFVVTDTLIKRLGAYPTASVVRGE